jgi:N-acetylglucosaminyldiphosphoundecaprenol N-acetyl-beta-D-mannosaminyltransferase
VRASALRPGSVRILGVRVDALTYAGLLDHIAAYIADRAPHHICTTNPEFVMEARRNPEFRAVLEAADLCMADGVGLLWAARQVGGELPERVTGSDGVPLIAEAAAQHGWRMYLLGAAPGVAEAAGRILQARYPGLTIAGAYPGSPADADAAAIIERIRTARPDILLVAYGAPRHDIWIARHRDSLRATISPACRSARRPGCSGSTWSGCTAWSRSRGAGAGSSICRGSCGR